MDFKQRQVRCQDFREKNVLEMLLNFAVSNFCFSSLTGVSLAEHLDGGGHFLLTDAFILLPLGGSLEPLPGQRAQVEVHKNVTKRLQVVSPRLFCGAKYRSRREKSQKWRGGDKERG